MLITRQNTWQPGIRKRTIKKEFKVGPMSLNFIALALIAVGALFYLAQSTQGSAQKYKINQLTDTKNQLISQSKDLEIEAVRLKSLNEIKSTAEGQGLVSEVNN